MQIWTILGAIMCLALATTARADPGLAAKVEGARIREGVTELEFRHGRMNGDDRDRAAATVFELGHGFTRNVYGEVSLEFAREPGGARRLDAIGIEGMVGLGRSEALDLDFALFAEYVVARGGADEIEANLIAQHQAGPFDARLNLIAERELERGEPVELSYGLSADWKVAESLRLGGAAFGDLGTTSRFLPKARHYAGPTIKTEVEDLGTGDLDIEVGYHFALGSARNGADGHLRLVIEYEFRF